MNYEELTRPALIRLLQEHDEGLEAAGRDGIVLNYTGRTAPWQIIRQVKPKLSRIIKKLSVGDEKAQSQNEIWDGENLSTMVTLYKYRGHIDLILTDPPYNTGEDFRYNDKWDKDPNDPDLGDIVPKDDGSRHSKWLKFMTPRLWMMREMLKPDGVLAICIDHRELFRLGAVLDEMFGEMNRIAIINWQKSYAPKNNVGKRSHVSTSTEYVLVYAKNIDRAKTQLLPRREDMDARYLSPDGDPDLWKPGDLTGPGAESHRSQVYGIQNPFTGEIVYPSAGRCWAAERPRVQRLLEAYGSKYVSKAMNDGCIDALVIKGSLEEARRKAEHIRDNGVWPAGHWRDGGVGTFGLKKYLHAVKKGIIPMTYWSDDDYDERLEIGPVSWDHGQSGHSQSGFNELSAIVGRGHGFDTVKPLKLIKKLIQIWCRPDGIVLDPFAGSGTTAQAVLELNHETDARRRFILIEQGNTAKGDHYAKTLTAERIGRVVTGDWASGKREPIPGGFRFIELTREKIDAAAVNALAREEMIDLLLTSYWNKAEKARSYLRRFPPGQHQHLFAVNPNNEGFFLVWEVGGDPSVLSRPVFKKIADEAHAAGLAQKYHVYASLAPLSHPLILHNLECLREGLVRQYE